MSEDCHETTPFVPDQGQVEGFKGIPPAVLDMYRAENKLLRQLLWLRHGCSGSALYGDDGEMQCNKCVIDFRRDTPEQIENKFWKINQPILAELNELLRGPAKPIIQNPDGSIGVKE